MKIDAFICDHCGNIYTESKVVGINPTADLINRYNGYPTIPNPHKANIHYCTVCFKVFVIALCKTDRKIDEKGYEQEMKVYAYNLRERTILRYNSKNRHRKVAR